MLTFVLTLDRMWWHGCDSCRDAVPWRSRVLLLPDETESGDQVPQRRVRKRDFLNQNRFSFLRAARASARSARLASLASSASRAASTAPRASRSAFDARRRVSDAARFSAVATPAPSSRARFPRGALGFPRALQRRAAVEHAARLLDDGERARRRVLRVPTAASIPGPLSRAPPRCLRLRRAARRLNVKRGGGPAAGAKISSGDKRLGLRASMTRGERASAHSASRARAASASAQSAASSRRARRPPRATRARGLARGGEVRGGERGGGKRRVQRRGGCHLLGARFVVGDRNARVVHALGVSRTDPVFVFIVFVCIAVAAVLAAAFSQIRVPRGGSKRLRLGPERRRDARGARRQARG